MSKRAAAIEQYSYELTEWAELNPLRRFRRINHIHMRQLGVMVGVSEGTVRSWEIGSMRPSPKNMAVISKITGVTNAEWTQWEAGIPRIDAHRRVERDD